MRVITACLQILNQLNRICIHFITRWKLPPTNNPKRREEGKGREKNCYFRQQRHRFMMLSSNIRRTYVACRQSGYTILSETYPVLIFLQHISSRQSLPPTFTLTHKPTYKHFSLSTSGLWVTFIIIKAFSFSHRTKYPSAISLWALTIWLVFISLPHSTRW